VGAARFAAGDYQAALDAYQHAYLENIDEPAYLRQIAHCFRALKRNQEAIRFYKLYLQERPEAPDRGQVDATVRELESPPPPPPRDRGLASRWWLWTAVGGAAVVVIGVGLGVGLAAREPAFMATLPPFGPALEMR
jgi:tetratricopeptide (TPR) repeat protein